MVNYTDEHIKLIFDQIDINKDGKISRPEFIEACKSLDLKLDSSTIDLFIDAIDTDKDGEISLEEFKYFIVFKSGSFKNFDDFLVLTSQSVALLKKLVSTKVEHTADENSSISITIKDKAIESADKLSTFIEILGGDLKHHKELQRVITSEIKHQNALVFVFKVADKKLILENMPQYCEALKAVLLELGPDFKEMVESLEFDFVEVENGVQMIIDLGKNQTVQAFVQASQSQFKLLENFPVEFMARLGTNFDLNNYHLETEQMLTHKYSFEMLINTFNLSTLMGVDEVIKNIKSYVESKDFSSASMMITLLSMKNISLELDFDDKLRNQLKQQFGVQSKETILLDIVNQAKTTIEESGIKDFIDSMDFIKLALNDLKTAGLTELGIFVKVSHIHFGLNVKGNMYTVLNKILQLDQE
jgi:hypothetical protein